MKPSLLYFANRCHLQKAIFQTNTFQSKTLLNYSLSLPIASTGQLDKACSHKATSSAESG